MNWNQLLNNARRKTKFELLVAKGTYPETQWGMNEKKGQREEIERDYDRILFLAPTRRLADKTQVFPLEQNDSVRTRLTHSYEVSNLARSVGTQLAYEYPDLFPNNHVDMRNGTLTRTIPSLLAAIGLAHDLGNPPFGHQGESAIRTWFSNKVNEVLIAHENKKIPVIYNDFVKFDGNSQTIRLLTQLQILNDNYGVNLTYSVLAAILKYPQSSDYVEKNKKIVWDKHGYFYSEKEIVEDIWKETGLKEGVRHPLTYIMEACDDIAYSVLDAEDIVKKGLASYYDLINHLNHFISCQSEFDKINHKKGLDLINDLCKYSKSKHEEFSNPKLDLTPSELNDLSMQMFRVQGIKILIESVINAFVKNASAFMNDNNVISDLISISDGRFLCKALKSFDKKWGYKNKEVLKLELKGHNYICGLMDMLWIGIHGKLKENNESYQSETPFGKYAYGRISENYRRVFEDDKNKLPTIYKEFQLLTDAISGMTDGYLISLYNELSALREYR